jgi:hypothetical protein
LRHPLSAADEVLVRLPLMRRLAWNMVMWGRKRSAVEPRGDGEIHSAENRT